MSVDCAEFIAIAERIITAEQSEIACRVAAGRAYYGAFHCCYDLAERHPEVVLDPKLPTHERVYRAVGNLLPSALGSKDLKKLIYLAKNIRDVRNDADYAVKGDFPMVRTEQAIEAAKNVHKLYLQFRASYKI